MAFVIQSGVSKPASKRGRKPTEFPLADMEVGDSFTIEIDGEDAKAVAKSIESWRRKLRIAVKHFAEEAEGVKFETAQVATGLGIWRVA